MHVRIKLAIKLSCVFGAVCASLLFLVASIATVVTTQGIRDEAYKRLDNDVSVTLHTFGYFKDNALATAQMFASQGRVIRFAHSGGSGQDPAIINDMMGTVNQSQILKIYDANGKLLAQRGLIPEGSIMVADPPSPGLQLALAGETVKGVAPIGDGGLAVHGIAPIMDGDEIAGAVLVGTRLDQAFADQLKTITGLEVGIAAGDSRQSKWLAQTIYTKSGNRFEGEVQRSVVEAVRASGKVQAQTAVIDGQEHLAAFAPLFGDYSEFVGLLFIGESSAPLNSMIHRAQIFIFGLCVLAGFLAFGAATLLSRTITDPIRKLADHATAVARGNLDDRLDLHTGDELEQLADAFNAMTESLAIMKFNDQNANPLTKLPGNLVIEAEITRRLEMGEPTAVLYIDLDHFKAFNDKFGFEAGDRILQFTAEVLKESVSVLDNEGDFVGHIGGDDFIVTTSPAVCEQLSKEIIRRFDADVPSFYPNEVASTGFFMSIDRKGATQMFRICSASIAIVTNEIRRVPDFLALSSLAAEVKKVAKGIDGSSFARDRRSEKPTGTPKLIGSGRLG